MSALRLDEIGRMVRRRREDLGLSQARLARLSGLSRATINQLETGTIVDLGVSKLAHLLDLLGLTLRAEQQQHDPQRGLRAASQAASVSYLQSLTPQRLAQALASGELPAQWLPHLSTMLDEVPEKFIVSAVEEAARSQGVPAKTVWQHLLRWAREFKSPRPAWA
ncbi:helix-turn-helix transcriptional regulator [Piscinibacter sp.]|uniref:helix-turn-helix transcriptional regulator n=1 Tax=Piscinibacter sp. TaxID=1903157 RepID=UPI0039E6C23C